MTSAALSAGSRSLPCVLPETVPVRETIFDGEERGLTVVTTPHHVVRHASDSYPCTTRHFSDPFRLMSFGEFNWAPSPSSSGTATLAAGQATYNTVLNTAGTHSLVASYSGDANNPPSTSAAVTQTVSAATTTIAVTTSINPSVAGQAIVWTATVTGASPTGTVTFMNGATSSGTYTIPAGQNSAKRSITFASVGPGTRNLTAIYNGDANNLASTSPVYVQTVNKSPTTTTLTATPGPSMVGQSVTLTATVTGSAPAGTVTFMDGTTVLGTATLASKTASINVAFSAAGTHSLTAVYGGNVNYLASTSAEVSQAVSGTTSTTLTATPNPPMASQAITLSATVAGASPTGTVTFMDKTTSLGTASLVSGTATISYTFASAGDHSLTAVYGGDVYNQPSISAAVALTVTPYVAQVYYIHADHLDTPRVITDAAGNKVWEWQNTDPFGNNVPNENPSGQGIFEYNQRFPGQYFDKETNLHYNVNRDYNPAIGGYIQSDPIGLGGGINTYTYVNGNPLSYVDPLGLDTTVVCRSVGNPWARKVGAKHCFIVVWHMEEKCGKQEKVTDGQYSLAGNPKVYRQDSKADTFVDDKKAWNSGSPAESYPVPPPSGKTVPEFDHEVMKQAEAYDSQNGYDAIYGPNSNTATARIIERAGGSLPNIPGAYGQPSSTDISGGGYGY